MDTYTYTYTASFAVGAPPDGFLIDGHNVFATTEIQEKLGAPPDGFLIDGHLEKVAKKTRQDGAHRLTGFSSMDTRPILRHLPDVMAHRLTGFSSMDT